MKTSIIRAVANFEVAGKKLTRFGIVAVFVWIGALKFFTYEADGIVPFVAQSPLMSFFYNDPEQFKEHINKEGEFIAANHNWHIANNTYGFSYGLGILLITMGILVALHKFAPLYSMLGSALIVITTIGTLSFLITTPQTWVPDLGDQHSGFPFLSGRGRMVIKDLIIMGGALITMSDSAKLYLAKKNHKDVQKHGAVTVTV